MKKEPDERWLEEEMRRRSQLYELSYQVEHLKAVIAEELRLEPIAKWLNKTAIKLFKRSYLK